MSDLITPEANELIGDLVGNAYRNGWRHALEDVAAFTEKWAENCKKMRDLEPWKEEASCYDLACQLLETHSNGIRALIELSKQKEVSP